MPRAQRSLFDAAVAVLSNESPTVSPQPRPEVGAAGAPQSDIKTAFDEESVREGNRPGSAPFIAQGEKAKARDILAAVQILKGIDQEVRPATPEERHQLGRFPGFGAVARSIFPDPVHHSYRDASWREMGERLQTLLSPAEYESAKRTTFNAFYTSPLVISAIHAIVERLGVPDDSTVLEPGCGIGNFLRFRRPQTRYIGVEMDLISGRIARLLHPQHDIRIENFRDTRLADGSVDAVIGNVPFADIKLEHRGLKFSLHDFFFAKSLDALRPGGVLAMVTSRFTLDKQNASLREYLVRTADLVGAIRLPSDAFQREGTRVVTDVVILRKREATEPVPNPPWLQVALVTIDGLEVPVNRYFLDHPQMVLGTWSRQGTLYGGEGVSLLRSGDLEDQLRVAIERLPKFAPAPSLPVPFSPASFPTAGLGSLPSTETPISEGSFFVADHQSICQSIGGEVVPVVYGGTKLRANGTLVGQRLAGLIELRNRARLVLRSQNEGWSVAQRQEARQQLNATYDRFQRRYGPINKTTFSETRDGTVIRRMPNLVKFREDPDAMLVVSLEEYDEVTGQATKAAILVKDVVGKIPPVTTVQTAEEGLLVSLNQRGVVDLALIAQLYGRPEEEVITELGNLIFQDPEMEDWQTADAYLSGNVRAKLVAAKCAGASFVRNVDALQNVQPEDVLPSEIDANLGAPWIPANDIQAFAAELFRVAPPSVPVAHLAKEALWNLDADYATRESVAATSEFGTARANGAHLLELALNMKSPVIYDTIHHGDREERVVNQTETLAAHEKQRQIKEQFRAWVFTDSDRTERLVRIYNDAYNNLRPRLFDGAHLDFPGMNQTLALRPHQKDAVWRGMSAGNTLLAHAVGAGKTFTMAATGMKMKQAGLIQKPMYVVPNHLLEQFAREFLQLYPNAQLLVAAKEDLSRERRKQLTAKMATGQWDGIVVTHSSFERIGMSRAFQADFLREQIAEYETLMCEHAADKGANRNLIKTIEKQKAAYDERLRDLMAEEKKDDGLVFDELGVDHVFVDEAHYFKNLATPTKMDRVAGIQTGGSERAFDLYMKARYLHQQHAGHGLLFATGTPISNTMVEMYTMQRFLAPDGLRQAGLEHFDAWAATFGEVVDTMEISPDGLSLRPRSRFARFTNLPELQQLFRAFADVRTAEMLDLPRPRLIDGKPTVIACPMSAEQKAIQEELVERYERLRTEKVDPRLDNALNITTDGRKLALDARMLSATAEDFPESKINALVEQVSTIWRQTTDRRSTQLIFCDMGVHPTAWGFSVYEEIIQKLIAYGIPPGQVVAVGEADSDGKKLALFENVRKGVTRVLLGSTQKMGAGTNVQKRLVALHHLDAPWKPAEVEQREGRILRQGNENAEVAVYRYVTEGSFDAYMWQALETKAKFILQVMTGENAARRADDIGGQELSYAEVKAIASGNPAVLTLAEADAALKRLHLLKRTHLDEQFVARRKVRELPELIARQTELLARLQTDRETVAAHSSDRISIGNRPCSYDSAFQQLEGLLDGLPRIVSESRRVPLGIYCGLGFGLILNPHFGPELYMEGAAARQSGFFRERPGPRALLNALERMRESYGAECDRIREEIRLAESQLRDYQARLGQPFGQEGHLSELTRWRDQLQTALAAPARGEGSPQPSLDEIVQAIKALLANHRWEGSPARPQKRSFDAEEPVTARIRRGLRGGEGT